MTISVLMPVRDEGQTFGQHLRKCIDAIAGLDAELILLDNRSVDGCCHGLPSEVLIVRTEWDERPARLWRLGWSLAKSDALLWLPGTAFISPDLFRQLVQSAADVAAGATRLAVAPRRRIRRFAIAQSGPALLTREARARVERWARIPWWGTIAAPVAARLLRVCVPWTAGQLAGAEPSVPHGARTDFGHGEAGAVLPSQAGSAFPFVRRDLRRLTAIVTAHNEGEEVRRTVESVRANTRMDHEIIVVDDGSTDGSCAGLEDLGVRLIRHTERIGVAYSRNAGTRAAEGDVFAYLDGHQRVDPGCLDRCAEIAMTHAAITCAPCRPLRRRYPVGYGASFRLCPERGYFSARSRIDRPRNEVTRVSALHSPGYLIPRVAYDRVAWIGRLRGWGATDYSVAVKAFFADVDILLVSAGTTEHLFRKRIPYETTWPAVWRNHALIARVCFDDRTWSRHWLPSVFRQNLSEQTLIELESPAVIAERDAFLGEKVRPDREFWRGLLRTPEPWVLA